METYFTILYCPIRPLVDEKLSIALFLRSGDKVIFRYSHDKLKILKELLPEPAFKLLKGNLESFEYFFNDYSSENFGNDTLGLPLKRKLPGNLDNPSYFDYLVKYSNNLIQFSAPKPLKVSEPWKSFDQLYVKFIFDFDTVNSKELTFYERVTTKVEPKIREHVNINIRLTSEHIKNLVLPTPVWFIGKNEVEVTGQVFDFNKRLPNLESDISKHLNLIRSIQDTTNRKKRTHFVVGKEPAKRDYKHHLIWSEVRKSKLFDIITPTETDKITEYLIQHRVEPFIELENDN